MIDARVLPLIGVLLLFGLGCFWRAWVQYRRYGHAGVSLVLSGSRRQRLRDAFLSLLLLTTVPLALAAALWPETLANLYFLPRPEEGAWLVVGAVLQFGGVLLMVVAQLQMGASWRIGIEAGARPGLVTGGFYSVCRNPIFLSLFVSLAGLAVLLPTWVSVAILVGIILGVRLQVREEEAYLLATYGDAYREYAARVGRFLPGLGRLAECEEGRSP